MLIYQSEITNSWPNRRGGEWSGWLNKIRIFASVLIKRSVQYLTVAEEWRMQYQGPLPVIPSWMGIANEVFAEHSSACLTSHTHYERWSGRLYFTILLYLENCSWLKCTLRQMYIEPWTEDSETKMKTKLNWTLKISWQINVNWTTPPLW